jgi:hypothetical protein
VHAGDQESGRPRIAILISGMHRSGTSAITRVVSLLGAGLPDDMIEAKGDNERGFWEGRAVIDLDEKALDKFGSWWGGWQSVDTEPLLASRRLVESAQELVRKEFRDADIIVVKDPRVSRLLPLWQQALDEEGFRCVHVVALRHPGAVADSLRRRNELSPEASTLSWLAHTLDAEEHTREQQRVFVSFEKLLHDWRSEMDRVSRALDIAWPKAPDAVAEAVDDFIEPGLAHEAPKDAVPSAVSAVNSLYDVLQRWSADDRQPGDEEAIASWRALLAPIRGQRSAVALVDRGRRKTVEDLQSRGRKPGWFGSPRRWNPIQNKAYNVEAEAAWAWLMREQQHATDEARRASDGGPGPRTRILGRRRR